jgi:hypothetical protein
LILLQFLSVGDLMQGSKMGLKPLADIEKNSTAEAKTARNQPFARVSAGLAGLGRLQAQKPLPAAVMAWRGVPRATPPQGLVV